MKLLFTLIAFVIANISIAQSGTQLILKSKIYTDGSNKDGVFWYRIIDNKIIYTYDSLSQKFVSSQYQVSAFEDVGMDSTKEGTLKRYHKKYTNEFTPEFFKKLKLELNTCVDSLRGGSNVHTSHHYENFYITIIENGDTIGYVKTKPFAANSPWMPKNANPAVDKMILQLLPNDFLMREKLNLKRNTKSEDYISEFSKSNKLFRKYWKQGKVTPIE